MRIEMAALQQFKASIQMAEELRSIERDHFHNPPRSPELKAVEGLRCGVAILSVAAFESFLMKLVEEQLGEMRPKINSTNFSKLPDELRINSIYKTLEYAMKTPPFQVALPKKDRLINIHQACINIIAGAIDPAVFCNVSSNPNSKNVQALFKDLDISNVFNEVKSEFDKKWGSPTADRFIELKLDEIVNRRHIAAHKADALGISRTDLKESLKFLKVLADVLEAELKDHIKRILARC
jgi:RiboL-PSP-HEPN